MIKKALDEISGRVLMRWLGMAVCTAVGLGIAAAFISWGVFHQPVPPLPMQDLLMAGVPYGYQAYDNWVRQHGQNVAVRTAAQGDGTQINPHGGPSAP